MRLRILVVVLLVLGLAGCGDDDGSALADISGRTFLSESVKGHELVPGTEIRLEQVDDEVRVNAGCNHLFGTLRIDDDRLFVESMGGTEMGCDPERHGQDEWITDFLGAGPTYEVAGDRLVLTSGDVVLTLLRAQP